MRWFKVTLKRGKVASCVALETAPVDYEVDIAVFYVREANKDAAGRAAMNRYAALKCRERRARNSEHGKCNCGRPKDRFNPKGGMFTKCSVCAERHKATLQRARQGKTNGVANRDEAARIEKHGVRIRDRRNEIRIEVLLEVQKAWTNNRTVGAFSIWLNEQIQEALKPRVSNDSSSYSDESEGLSGGSGHTPLGTSEGLLQ